MSFPSGQHFTGDSSPSNSSLRSNTTFIFHLCLNNQKRIFSILRHRWHRTWDSCQNFTHIPHFPVVTSHSFHLPWFHDPKNTSCIKTIKLPTVKYTAFSWYYVLPRSKCAMQHPVLKSHAPTIHYPYLPAYFPVLEKESRLMRTPCRLCVSVCHRSQCLKYQPIFTNLQ